MNSIVTHTATTQYATTYYVRDPQGNVMAVISDAPGGGTQPTVESLTDYYPFGRLGRRWNVDIVGKAYESSYSVLGNTPLIATDVNGADSTLFNENGSILCKIANDNGKTSEYFVVRTTQTTEEMYGGINYTDSKVKGWTAPISQNEQTKSILSAMSYGTTKSFVGDNPNTLQKVFKRVWMEHNLARQRDNVWLRDFKFRTSATK